MTRDKAHLLHHLRREAAWLEALIQRFQEERLAVSDDIGVDVTMPFVAELRRRVRVLQVIADEHDPDGFTKQI